MSKSPPAHLRCADCGDSFAFNEGERAFFERRGLSEAPRRCPRCRQARKTAAKARYGGGARPPEGRPVHAAATTFEVVCAACGGPAHVSFRPPIGRLIYCHECYAARQAHASGLVSGLVGPGGAG